MQTIHKMSVFLRPEQQDLYLELPYQVPEDVCRIDVRYDYSRWETRREVGGEIVEETSIIDLALCAPEGEYLGCSGADREHITIGESYSSPGYATVKTRPGRWSVIVGAAKVHPRGVEVRYEITFTHKEPLLLKGDLHTHTVGSDGYLTIDELTDLAVKNGLDYLCITDHNNYDHNGYLRPRPDITLIPGTEWTHFKGHIGMLGVERPFSGPFYANDLAGVNAKVREAMDNGALVIINHPFEPDTGFRFGLENVAFDCVELWNGPFTPAMRQCLDWWQRKLVSGAHIPIVGGSDFHYEQPGRFVGAPCTCVYARSNTPSDILAALRNGNCFLTCTPKGPECRITCNGKLLGEVAEATPEDSVELVFGRLEPGDLVKIITDQAEETLEIGAPMSRLCLERPAGGARFLRAEVHRSFLSGEPARPAMISNPLYLRQAPKM